MSSTSLAGARTVVVRCRSSSKLRTKFRSVANCCGLPARSCSRAAFESVIVRLGDLDARSGCWRG
eukprot:695621-Prymnesium_polylepis.1